MKTLTYRQAAGCENARSSRCRCRCGGRFHGAGRGEVVGLPRDDPHAVDLPAALAELGDGVQLSLFADASPLERISEIRSRLLAGLPADRARRWTTSPEQGSRPLQRPPGPSAA